MRQSLPFRDTAQHLQDILDSIALIQSFMKDITFPVYAEDAKTKSAVERQIQIITEAAYRLGDQGDVVCPGPDWKGLMGMGNLLRHAYHRIDDKIIWNTVQSELPILKVAIAKALARG